MAATDGAKVAGGRVATVGSTDSLNGSASFGVGAGVSIMPSSSVVGAGVSGMVSVVGAGVCSIVT